VKAMKNDVILKRVAAFSKRLLQVCWLNCSKVILLMWILLKFATPSDHYYLLLMWMYLETFYCLDTSILETSNSGQREYLSL
jgi:hypothetical protein